MSRIQHRVRLSLPTALLLAIALVSTIAPAAAQDCLNWNDMPRVVGSTPSGGARGVAVSADGSTAYLAAASIGLRIVDIGDPANPSELCTFAGDDYSLDVAVAGQYVYLPDRDAGLKIVDVSDPSAPALAGQVDIPGSCFYVEAAGGHVYVTDYWNLYVIDAADPATAAIVATLPMAGGNKDLVVAGDRAYLASSGEGLCVIDVSVPTAPSVVTTLPVPGDVGAVAVAGDHAYLSAWSDGIHVVDIADPAVPALVSSLDTIDIGDNAQAIAERSGFVYLATAWGLQIIDVFDPANPQLVNRVGGFEAYGVALRDDWVLLGADWHGMLVIDAYHPDLTARTTVFETDGFTANDMAIRDGLGYVGHGGGGVQVVDLADPDAPVTVANLETANSVIYVEFYGDYLVAVDLSYALYVIDIADPAQPVIAGSLPLYEIANGLAVAPEAGQAYVSMNWGGVLIIDISDPTAPTELHEIWDMWQAGDIAVDYPLIYFADYDYGFQAYDVSNPYDPVRVGTTDGYGYGGGVALDLDAGVAYTAGEGLMVVDISDPTAMSVITEVSVPGDSVVDIELNGDMAYIAGLRAGLHAVNISDRRAPVHVATAMTGDEGRCLAMSDQRVYLAAHFGQLEIFLPHCATPNAAPSVPPAAIAALDAFPNPFNPRTTLGFDLPRAVRAELVIHDLHGRRVREVFTGELTAGAHRFTWDGLDDGGRGVATGVYLARLRAAGAVRTAKLALVR